MKLRRLFTALLAIAMLLTMVACAKETEKSPASNGNKETAANTEAGNANEQEVQQAGNDTEADATGEAATDANGEAAADTTVEAAAQQEQLAISKEEEDKNDKVGYVSGNTYRNPYYDLTFTAPENAAFYDAQELLAMSDTTNLPADTEAAFAAQMEQAGAYVMMVTDLNGAGVNLLVKKTPEAYKGLSDEQIYAIVKPELKAQLQQTGLTGAVEIGSTAFLNETRAVLNTTMQEVDIMQRQLYLVQDEYTCIITAAANDAETLDAIMVLFTR